MRRQLVRAALVAALVPAAVLTAQSAYVPQRVYQTAKKQFTDFESLLADAARADVLFIGEQHDNLATHRLELQLLEGLARRRGGITLALEMFERDVQEPLAHFLMGHLAEAEFLAEARPWPQYARDYKPLVDFAIARQWNVVAGNVPRGLAAEVSRGGLDVLTSKSDAERQWFARDVQCPLDDRYFRNFKAAMGGDTHSNEPGQGGLDAKTLERYYFAQCLKDETMGESIAQSYAAAGIGLQQGQRPLIVSVNGSFHSDYGDGTVARTRRRLPGKRIMVVAIVPADDIDNVKPDGDDRKRADYLIYTVQNPK